MLASSDGVHWHDVRGRRCCLGTNGRERACRLAHGRQRRWPQCHDDHALAVAGTLTSWERLGALPEGMTGGFMTLAGSQAGYVLLSEYRQRRLGPLVLGRRPAVDRATYRAAAPGHGNAAGGHRRSASTPGASTTPPPQVMACSRLTAGPGPRRVRSVPVRSWTWWRTATICWQWVAGRVGTRMWKGTIEGQQLTWSTRQHRTLPNRGRGQAGERRGTGDRPRAGIGRTETPLWWQRDGLSWQRHAMPADFGGLPSMAVGGPQWGRGGWAAWPPILEGCPLFWHLGDGAVWEREAIPVMPAPTAPTPRTCGPKPDDLLGAVERGLAVGGDLLWRCADHGPGLVRGLRWLLLPIPKGRWQTEWLAQPADWGVIHLAPYQSDVTGAPMDGVLHPSRCGTSPRSRAGWRSPDTSTIRQAASCRWTPTLADEYWYSGTRRHRGQLPRAASW